MPRTTKMNWKFCKSGKWILAQGRRTLGEIYVENYPKEGIEYIAYKGRFRHGGERIGFFKCSIDNAKARVEEAA